MLDLSVFPGRVSCITGPGKNCGKTQFMNYLAGALSEKDSGAALALMTAGYDGETRDLLSGAKKPQIRVKAGTIVVTPERFARTGGILPEILETVPGSTSLGPCCIARARRSGFVTLASPEGNAGLRWALDFIRGSGAASTVLVDGAFNRITQTSAWPGSQIVFMVRTDRATLAKSAELLERFGLLETLPVYKSKEKPETASAVASNTESAVKPSADIFFLNDVLSAETVGMIPKGTKKLVVEDFTKIFLDLRELKGLLSVLDIFVKASIPCPVIPVITRGLSHEDFRHSIRSEYILTRLAENPYLEGESHA